MAAQLSRLMKLNYLGCWFGLVKICSLCYSLFNRSLNLHVRVRSKQGGGGFMLAESTQQRPFKLGATDLNITGLLGFLAKS